MSTLDIALISDGVVVNVALASDPADAGWLAAVEQTFDAVVDVTDLDPRPGIGWAYDGTTFAPLPDPDQP